MKGCNAKTTVVSFFIIILHFGAFTESHCGTKKCGVLPFVNSLCLIRINWRIKYKFTFVITSPNDDIGAPKWTTLQPHFLQSSNAWATDTDVQIVSIFYIYTTIKMYFWTISWKLLVEWVETGNIGYAHSARGVFVRYWNRQPTLDDNRALYKQLKVKDSWVDL